MIGDIGPRPRRQSLSRSRSVPHGARTRRASRGAGGCVSTTLARLYEYRRTVRRVRALQDVLLPELDADIADIDTRLEDIEREDAIAMRFRRAASRQSRLGHLSTPCRSKYRAGRAFRLPGTPADETMRDIRREALCPFHAAQMFDLIERVENYPQFLPWCLGTQLISRTPDSVSASVEVGVREMRVRVTTRNDKRAPEFMAIHMEGGSFRHFYGEWALRPLGDIGCHISFRLQYELALRADAGRPTDRTCGRSHGGRLRPACRRRTPCLPMSHSVPRVNLR
jgi:ribosome-associated toxin RatA of RatAB toxin-antitoxin module